MLYKRLLPYVVIFVALQSVIRLSLFIRATSEMGFDFLTTIAIFAKGFWFDVVTVGWVLLPIAIYHLCLVARRHGNPLDIRIDQAMRVIFCYMLLFDAVAEHLFWSEFTTRFNFIAVDYLVYTQEVIGNIVESYPLGWLLAGIGVAAVFVAWMSWRLLPLRLDAPVRFKSRLVAVFALLLVSIGLNRVSDVDQAVLKGNVEASELASNGIYNLFYAFWNNEINYDRFYAMQSDAVVEKRMRGLLQEENAIFVQQQGKDLSRIIRATGKEKHKNVMMVVMESMSADYMGAFGNKDGLTPNLDRLATEGLTFTNAYATGTRTVRGLEAVTLSIPPTPGQSIIRRPGNDNLSSLGFVFQDRGYDTKFIYGGYGYFDNMNAFFSANGFGILDRTAMKKEYVGFANVWGVCDEDMFAQAVREADQSYTKKQPFMHVIMTTSNHRPYTYPDGKIDIPSHTSRYGGVKYADYSVGRLIEEAKTKPWFKDTIFIFVADHTAGAGGKAELDPHKYHIPMIFYAPDMIKPQRFDAISSQIDAPPILLGMLDFTYYSKFYGEDLLHDTDEMPHAFISNFQKVALVKDDGLTVLAPKQKVEQYSWPAMESQSKQNTALNDDAIAYYQSASWWKEQLKRIPTVVKP